MTIDPNYSMKLTATNSIPTPSEVANGLIPAGGIVNASVYTITDMLYAYPQLAMSFISYNMDYMSSQIANYPSPTQANTGMYAYTSVATMPGTPPAPTTDYMDEDFWAESTPLPAPSPETSPLPVTPGGGVGGQGIDCGDDFFSEPATTTNPPLKNAISDIPVPQPNIYVYADYMGSPPNNTGLA